MMKLLNTIALSTLCMLAVTGCSKGASTQDAKDTILDSSAVVSSDTIQDTAVENVVAEPEPAYIGDDNSAKSESYVVEGVTIKKGDPIVETLKKFKKVSWEYNADFGVTAYVGNVWIVVDEVEDLNAKGREFMKGIYSDMVPDLQFSLDYIKPTAKIKEIHKD